MIGLFTPFVSRDAKNAFPPLPVEKKVVNSRCFLGFVQSEECDGELSHYE